MIFFFSVISPNFTTLEGLKEANIFLLFVFIYLVKRAN